MATWDELDNKEDYEKDEEQANLAFMAITSTKVESDSDSSSEFEDEDEVFSKLSCSYLITFVQELMGRCQKKVRHMKILKKQYDLFKDELKSIQNKNEALQKDHISLLKEVSNKPLDEREMDNQESLMNGFNTIKLASMIYGVSRTKGEGLGCSKKYFNPRFETLRKPIDPSFSNSAQKGIKS